jgi:phage minor structural protein
MNLYLFDFDENLISILDNTDLISFKHTEKLTGENYINVSVADSSIKSTNVLEGNYFAFYDLDNDFIMFEILTIEDEETDQGILKACYCENCFYELRDYVIEDRRVKQATATVALTAALSGTRWTVGTVDSFGVYAQNFYYQSSLEALNDIKTRWQYTDINSKKQSGILKYRLILTGNVITSRIVDYKRTTGAYRGKRAVIGKDLTSIKRTVDNTYLITAAYGRGKGEEITSDQEAINTDLEQKGIKTCNVRTTFKTTLWRNDFPTLTNTGFEDGFDQWTTITGTTAIDTLRYYRGSQCLKMTDGLVVYTTVYSTLNYTVTPAQVISGYCWVNTPTTIDGYQKGIKLMYNFYLAGAYVAQAVTIYKPIAANNWEKVTLIATVPAGVDSVRFIFSGISSVVEAGDMYVDEFHPSFAANKPTGQEYVEDIAAKALYGRAGGTINRMGLFEDEEEVNSANLLQKTWDYIQDNNTPKITYEAKILDLETLIGYSHEKMRIGDLIYILDENFRVPVDVLANIIEIERDYLLQENTDVTLGNYIQDNADINKRQADLEKKVLARANVWDRGSNFATSPTGNNIRMGLVEGTYQSAIKYEDDNIPPNSIGYFSPTEFNYSVIRSDQFIGQNIITTISTALTYYIDSYAGNDFNSGLIGFPYKTIGRIMMNGTIPKVLLDSITIHITDSNPAGAGSSPYYENVIIDGILGSAGLYLNFDQGVILNGNIHFINCSAFIYVQGSKPAATVLYGYINCVDAAGTIPIYVDNCTWILVRYLRLNANLIGYYAVIGQASIISIDQCICERATIASILSNYCSKISIATCIGTNATVGAYGIKAMTGAYIGCFGSIPQGAAGNIVWTAGAMVVPSAQTGEAVVAGAASPAGALAPAALITNTSLASSSLSWQYIYQAYRPAEDYIYQGSWGFGNHMGIILFNGAVKFSTIAAAAVTIKAATLSIKRRNIGGYAEARNIEIWGHDRLTAPAPWYDSYLKRDYGEIASIKWGEQININMPAQFLLDVKSGLVTGLAIYEVGEVPYVILEGVTEYAIKIVFKY